MNEGADASAQEFHRRTDVDARHDPLVGAAHGAWLFTAHGAAMRELVRWMKAYRALPSFPPDVAGVDTMGFGPLWSVVPEILYARDVGVRAEDMCTLVTQLLPVFEAYDRGPTPGEAIDACGGAFVFTLRWLWPRDRVALEPALVALAARARIPEPEVRSGLAWRDRWKRAWTRVAGMRAMNQVPETRMVQYLIGAYGRDPAQTLLSPGFAETMRARDEAFQAKFRPDPPAPPEETAARALEAWGPSFLASLRVARPEIRDAWIRKILDLAP